MSSFTSTPLAKLLMSFQLPRTEMTQDRNERYAKKLCLDPFADLRDGASSSEQSTVATVCTSVQDELARYKALKVPAASLSFLQYWKHQTSEYPILSRVARRLFCIPASSAQSERDFLAVGKRPPISAVGSKLKALHSILPKTFILSSKSYT